MTEKEVSSKGGGLIARNAIMNVLRCAIPLLVAEYIGKNQIDRIQELIFTALTLMSLLGLVISSIGILLIPWAVADLLIIPPK